MYVYVYAFTVYVCMVQVTENMIFLILTLPLAVIGSQLALLNCLVCLCVKSLQIKC